MRKLVLIAVTALGLAATGAAGPVYQALAQPAPAPADAPPPGALPAPHPWAMGGMDHGMHGGMHGPEHWHHAETFALLQRPADRALTGADVQRIAEAFLLWNGNHTWKITGVTEQDAATVGFSVATPGGDVIARFTMNRHTGEIARVS
jgi:hypothetical protein